MPYAWRGANTQLVLSAPVLVNLQAPGLGAAAVGLAGRGSGKKTVAVTGSSSVGLGTSASSTRKIAQTGRIGLGLAGSSELTTAAQSGAYTHVTITRDYDLADGAAPIGFVYFTPSDWLLNNGVTLVPAAVAAPLDSDGRISISLAANTDPDTSPAASFYVVREAIIGQPERSYTVQIPHNSGLALDLSTLPVIDYLSTPSIAPTGSTGPVEVTYLAYTVIEGPLSLIDPRVGCALDGTGDESAKVATAIGLLPAAGGHIYQPPGILRTGAISFDRPVTWEGAGDGASTIKAASAFTGDLVTISSTAPFSRITNVALDGGGSANVLILVASARARLDHLHMTATGSGTTGGAIHFNGASSIASAHAAQVSDVRIISCGGYGVYVHGFAYDQEFTNVWIGSCQVGMRIENTNGLYTNLHVWGSVGNGLEIRNGLQFFNNCYVETNGANGFNIFNADRVKISNSVIWKNQQQGVSLSGTSHRFGISNSMIYDQGGNGIQAADCLHGKVIGCDFYDDTGSAQTQDRPVVTTGTSDKWIIVDNTMLTSEHATGANSLVGANNVVANNVTA